MAALNFPDSPNDGDEFSGYVYDSAKGVWNRLPTLPALDLVNFSAVAPSNPQDGQFWFDTTSSKMYVYYNDGSSAQWVSTIGGLASQTGTEGQFLIHDGTEWLASEFTSPGSVLQVVSTAKTDTFTASTTSGIFVDVTGLAASITPRSSSSKILVQVHIAMGVDSSLDRPQYFQIKKDGSPVAIGDASEVRMRVSGGSSSNNSQTERIMSNSSMAYLDSPASASPLTYSVAVTHEISGSSTVYVNRSQLDDNEVYTPRGISTITLLEVAG